MTKQKQTVLGREWRFGYHLPNKNNQGDYHMVKEILHLPDGSTKPNLRFIKDYKRPVWMAKPQHRLYKDKKEYEELAHLDEHYCTQSDLRNKVAVLTGKGWSQEQLSELCTNPYIYGADISSTSIMCREVYQKSMGELPVTPYRNASFDTETDMLYGTGEIIIGSMAMFPEVHIVIREDFLNGNTDIEERFRNVMREKIGPEIDQHNLIISYEIVKTEIDIVEKSFAWFHERKPDWMSIWSMDFDITKVMNACERSGVDPKMILCDPSIPYDFRICRYKRGQTKRITASGVLKPVSPYDQWHTLFLTASFYVIDAMCVYRLLRLGSQEERSYSLDAILQKELNIRKLSHAPADKYIKGKWHEVMQKQYKIEYLAYAAFDSIAMILLDRKIRDLSHKLPSMADITEFSQCNSQPKRLRDAFYVFAKEDHNCIIGSVGYTRDKIKPEEMEVLNEAISSDEDESVDEDEEEEEESKTLDRKGWVITLPSHYSANGLALVEESPHLLTGIRAFTYDIDAVSSYPSCTQVGNVSKVTTRKELIKIGDIDEYVFRMQNLGLVWGETNAIEYSTTMFGTPTLEHLSQLYDQDNP